MVIIQKGSLRKPTGGRYKNSRPKRVANKGHKATLTTIGQTRTTQKRARGGKTKNTILSTDKVNLYDPKTGKHLVAKIKTVKDSAANRNYVRRNILTKGTIIETEKGMATITNRPGQDKAINATLN